jgi:hypothetical protein
MNFTRQQHYSHEITNHLGGGGPRYFCAWVPRTRFPFIDVPLPDRLWHVLAGGELTGGEGLTGHDLRDLGSYLGGEVLDGRRWNTAGDGEVRRPCRVTGVPSEGPVNTSK